MRVLSLNHGIIFGDVLIEHEGTRWATEIEAHCSFYWEELEDIQGVDYASSEKLWWKVDERDDEGEFIHADHPLSEILEKKVAKEYYPKAQDSFQLFGKPIKEYR